MALFTQLLVFMTLLSLVYASSFYDNPEQDPLPGTATVEELERKWDFEVLLRGFVVSPPRMVCAECARSGASRESRPLLTSGISNA